ncbi:APC family permease [Leucobacter massiliensis]|uniref:Amino acid permease n=1 Tax=Leucobacter massiliensis TaxID=1686285 RepID=A0A2S9QPJ9_9MICO|nr:amino acid permease [Leucobacter massiliensis]PRI11521.1 amino acid permease [Leucobacter massiliensis]
MSEHTSTAEHHDEDAAHLASLGYTYDPTFKREMGFWGNVSLGFTYLSPIAGVYAMFALSFMSAGPPMAWALVISLVGQFFVALVFGEVVSNYPVAGGVYPWSRRLWGRKWAWMNGWVYVWALIGTIAAVAYSPAPFMFDIFRGYSPDNADPTPGVTVLIALGVLAVATILNFLGTKVLSIAAMVGLLAEMIGSVAVGLYLIIRNFVKLGAGDPTGHTFGVFFDNQGIGNDGPFGSGMGGYFGAFAWAALIGMYAYYGFEANGDVAEEVKDPSRRVPKSMRMTLYIGGVTANLLVFSLVLAVPDYSAVADGTVANPISAAISEAFGPVFPIIMIIVCIAFISCVTSLQAAASRLMFSMGRDGFLPSSHQLAKTSAKHAVPYNALITAAVIPAIFIVLSLFAENALTALIGFGTVGIYMGFQMVVLAALRARILGWKPAGKFKLGKWAYFVNIVALVWGVLAIVNIAFPWPINGNTFLDWIILLTTAIIVAFGWIYMLASKAYTKGDAPAADASGPIKTVAR